MRNRRSRDTIRFTPDLAQQVASYMARYQLDDPVRAYSAIASATHKNVSLHPADLEQIDLALKNHLSLFEGESYPLRIEKKRRLALSLMHLLSQFHPILYGRVASGSALQSSPIYLALEADTSEEICRFLIDLDIPYRSFSLSLPLTLREKKLFDLIAFESGDDSIRLLHLPIQCRQRPLDPANGKPLRGLTLCALESQLSQDGQPNRPQK
jgi:hypothetical protein